MTGLVIKLSPNERILINGAVIENGDRRSRLTILSPDVNVLRLRDAIHPDKAVTPVSRLCFRLQMALIGENDADSLRAEALRGIEELSRVFTDTDSRSTLSRATDALLEGNMYKCFKQLRTLLPRENRLLAMSDA